MYGKRVVPKRLMCHAEVFVNDNVPHAAHFRPGQVGVGCDHLFGHVPRGLADDAKAEADGVNRSLVGEEASEIHVRRVALHAIHGRQDVLDAKASLPSWH